MHYLYTRKLNPHIWVQFICSWGTLEACNCLSPATQQFYLSVAAIAIVMSMDTNFFPECEKEVVVIEIHLVVDVGYKVGALLYGFFLFNLNNWRVAAQQQTGLS